VVAVTDDDVIRRRDWFVEMSPIERLAALGRWGGAVRNPPRPIVSF